MCSDSNITIGGPGGAANTIRYNGSAAIRTAGTSVAILANTIADNVDDLIVHGGTASLAVTTTDALTVTAGAVTVGTQATVGAVDLQGGSVTLSANATFTASGDYDQSGGTTTLGNPATLAVGGELALSAGTLTGDLYPTLDLGSYLQSGGTMSLTYGTFLADDDVTLTAGTVTMLYSSGSIGDQMLLNGGTWTLDNLTSLTVTGGISIGSAGTLILHRGTLVGNVTNAGLFRTGAGGSISGGGSTIQGNFTQTSTGRLNFQSTGSTGDRLTITGSATLAGVFDLDFLNGYSPLPGTSWEFLQFGSRSGTFGSHELPPPAFGSWQITYDPDSFNLLVMYY